MYTIIKRVLDVTASAVGLVVREPDPERRAVPGVTLDRDGAAHRAGELSADGEAEAGAAA